MARLVGHNPPPRPPGGRGGGVIGGMGEGVSRPGGDGVGTSREGSNMGAAKVATERARVDAAEARIVVLTAQVEALEDFRGWVDRLTHGMPTQGLMDDFEEVCLETVMAHERD